MTIGRQLLIKPAFDKPWPALAGAGDTQSPPAFSQPAPDTARVW
jgi:hypothetical protein